MIQPFPAAESTTTKHAVLPSAPPRRRRVAIADDTRGMRVVLGGILRDEGYDVREACDGVDLLALVERFHPDVIVTDFRMPRMSGLDVLRELRARSSRAVVILMTASPLDELREAAISLGASAVLPKPFDLGDLLEVIEA